MEVFLSDFQEYLRNGLSDTNKNIFLALCKLKNQVLLWINMVKIRNFSEIFRESLLKECGKTLLTVQALILGQRQTDKRESYRKLCCFLCEGRAKLQLRDCLCTLAGAWDYVRPTGA